MSAPEGDNSATAAAAGASTEQAQQAKKPAAEEHAHSQLQGGDDYAVEGEHHDQRIIKAELGEMTELESMCPKCEENGVTRLMITEVPFFKQIIVSSFACEHCGERNTEVSFGGSYGPKRTRHHLTVKCAEDMGRQIVKSEHAILRIPELELELPRETQKGSLNTIEGVLVHTIEGLQFEQPVRRIMEPEFAAKIDDFCKRLESYRDGSIPFSIILDDPAGNSFIQPRYDYYHPTIDAQLQLFTFTRTREERLQLGLPVEDEEGEHHGEDTAKRRNDDGTTNANDGDDDANDHEHHKQKLLQKQRKLREGIGASMYNTLRTAAEEKMVDDGEVGANIIEMKDLCPACHMDSVIRMHPCNIPYFRETIIMAFKCDHCGYKSTEVQTGGAIPTKGKRVTLHVLNETDLKRDVLKSNTASLEVPELELELVAGTLGGFFTTVQGLLNQVLENLKRTPTTDFSSYGDGAAAERKTDEEMRPERQVNMRSAMEVWLTRLEKAVNGEMLPLTVILDDPLGSVYVQNPRAHLPPPDNLDPQLVEVDYERTWEQDEDLGLHDMDCEQH
jgi:zinc finger protein